MTKRLLVGGTIVWNYSYPDDISALAWRIPGDSRKFADMPKLLDPVSAHFLLQTAPSAVACVQVVIG